MRWGEKLLGGRQKVEVFARGGEEEERTISQKGEILARKTDQWHEEVRLVWFKIVDGYGTPSSSKGQEEDRRA